MRASTTPVFRVGERFLAALLTALLAVTPVAAQSGGDSTTKPASSTPAKPKSTKKPAAAGTAANSPSAKKAAARGRSATAKKSNSANKPASAAKSSAAAHRKPAPRAGRAARTARTARIKQAFVASTELRPMAQQLATLRTPAAYAGVTKFAHAHTGDAAAAAYLALGHSYLLDKRFGEAEANLIEARKAGDILADYADFLGAQSNHEAGNDATAEGLLHGFAARYPDSIFNAQAPELEANVLLALNNPTAARQILAANPGSAGRPGYQLAQGQIALKLNQNDEAERIFKHLLLSHPLGSDAQIARAKLTSMGAEATLTTAELRSLGDAYYNANRFEEAAEQYRALMRNSTLDANTRNGFAVAEAACELKMKQLTKAQAEALADTHDENGARRLYLLMELARNKNDLDEQQRIVTEMESTFPHSPWLAEALFSSGNMYMLRHDYPNAVDYYGYLATHFPENANAAAAHWRAGWFSYRQGLYPEAARLFDEQLKLYPSAVETSSALYWRGRLYEMQDKKPALAAANYRTLVRVYQHYFYAQMARQRLAALGSTQAAQAAMQTQLDQAQLDRFKAVPIPHLDESFPSDSPHLAKAHLLANAGLNDYISQEIAADPDSASWSALAEAQIYASFNEPHRAMRALKKALPFAATASIKSIPLAYWHILFPDAWWEIIKTESAKNNLDPYMVASLIRQESEFNPSVVSYANAYGLMQLLPSVGKQMAHEEGISHFETYQLLDPAMNIRLGTRYLRQMLEHFGGVQEYALAAYNAGDSRVVDWEAAGPYHGMDEFVESIPFTQTREYVEAILRNEETYRAIDEYAATHAKAPVSASR